MIYRIDVRMVEESREGDASADPVGTAVRHQIEELGMPIDSVQTHRIFLLDAQADRDQVKATASRLLADPIVETAEVANGSFEDGQLKRIEVHLKPGVMDPVATSTEQALRGLGLDVREVRTGRAFLLKGNLSRQQLEQIANRVLANGVIESVHFDPFVPQQFEAGREYTLKLRHVDIRTLDDAQLQKLSREGHLFLSLDEMRAIQNYYREQNREPTDIELETLAQTWSEHCVHKTLKSAVDVEVRDEAGTIIGHRRYDNLIKETIFNSTMTLMKGDKKDFCLSVFVDNAGVIGFDDQDAVCFKVETHNHPSAIEPYGGSATGIGGVIRDILGTGLGARPVANSDVFCVAPPDTKDLPRGVIHPKRVLQQIVAGVRDYGNRMGIPTINGAVYFDPNYLGNPLVFCGCVGLIPRNKIHKETQRGDAIVVMGGRTGRDGIHGATFSSAELTDTHADEFSHAVQIGNAITEKKVSDVILTARDRGLFTAVTDCGAGGLSSAIGEMGEKIGAEVHLDRVPLKYQGLRYDEIWISEAQERMVLSVPQDNVQELLDLSKSEDVESIVIGTFGTPTDELVLHYGATEVGRLSMHFMHKGIPMPTRKAVVTERKPKAPATGHAITPADFSDRLLSLLGHPNIASKHWIIRQYDHEVQGGSVVKPLVGPLQIGPSDASVIRPKLNSMRGVVISCGLVPAVEDPYEMALAAMDEAIRNAVCVGASLDELAVLDNFCWPSVDDEPLMGTLVRACEACRDGALAYGVPFISGKDSLHNQFTNQETGKVLRIRNTLLISAIGVLSDVRKCVTMDLKGNGLPIVMVRSRHPQEPAKLAILHRAVSNLIASGAVRAAHDISDGGAAVAVAEMCIGGGRGAHLNASTLLNDLIFTERPGGYVLEMRSADDAAALHRELASHSEVVDLGTSTTQPRLAVVDQKQTVLEVALPELTRIWRGTLDW